MWDGTGICTERGVESSLSVVLLHTHHFIKTLVYHDIITNLAWHVVEMTNFVFWSFVVPSFLRGFPTELTWKTLPLNAEVKSDPFEESMIELGLSESTQSSIRTSLDQAGFEDRSEIILLAKDFLERPEVFSDLLQADFGFSPLLSHRIRAIVMDANEPVSAASGDSRGKDNGVNGLLGESVVDEFGDTTALQEETQVSDAMPSFKSVVVNEKQARRHRRSSNNNGSHGYGLPNDYQDRYPILRKELDKFMVFMTRPSTLSQESPIRKSTADVYLRHAKLFLGWFVNKHKSRVVDAELSIFSIVPSKEKDSADVFLDFVMWLRQSRQISASYEANLLRGLTKLLKFRFAKESESDPSYGEHSFSDIPIIRELRKLHRDANRKQRLSPRSSDEDRKWMSWEEYLQVIEAMKQDLEEAIRKFEQNPPTRKKGELHTAAERTIAKKFQAYLVLAFFASVPDRQRTFRELELGRSFVKDKTSNLWTIRHGPDDYKTGKTYGDRPPLVIAPDLVPAIDDFVERWRPCLSPSTESFFVQSRTGKPLTQDSVYQIVARNCYTHTGKKTNPHLLRDMIVTHVRGSDASEKQLEALALYMGHSIQMQRDSYDRRTLTKKVEPAVELLQTVNQLKKQKDTKEEKK